MAGGRSFVRGGGPIGLLLIIGTNPMAQTETKHTASSLAAALREDILRGRLRPGAALPTQGELGQMYGLCESTASGAVRRLMHEGLVVRFRRRGSFVAKHLPTQHKILDFVRMSGRHQKAWSLAWIEKLTHFSEQHGWTPRWHHVPDEETANIEQLAGRFLGSKGVVIFGSIVPELPWLLSQRGVGVVTIYSARGGLGDSPTCYQQISFDRQESARLACEHLVSLGYTRIGYIGEPASRLRMLGFLDVIRRHKLPVQTEWLIQFEDYPSDDLNSLAIQVHQALKVTNWPEALCCANKDIASDVVRDVARDARLEVPRDLALVACDAGEPDIPGQLGITTVEVSKDECCEKVFDILEQIDQEANRNSPRLCDPIMMPLHLNIKDSCGAKLKGKET